jgi:hypothetical protein
MSYKGTAVHHQMCARTVEMSHLCQVEMSKGMGLVAMSLKDLQRIEVLTEVLGGRRTAGSAAAVLGLSVRQTHRLLVRYGDGGGGALIHQARGRASNNQLDPVCVSTCWS